MISDKELVSSYKKTNSVWKTAEELGLCGQYVHRRLRAINKNNKMNKFSEEEKEKLIQVYRKGFKKGDGVLENLSKELNRTKQFLCRQAKKLGLTNKNRSCNNDLCHTMSFNTKNFINKFGHNRGMLGKHHSKYFKEKISSFHKRRWESIPQEEKLAIILNRVLKSKISNNREKCSWKSGWRTIGGVKNYYRSKWEANYARYLQALKENGIILSWEHEPDSFLLYSQKGNPMKYVPDFKVFRKVDDKIYYNYHEVKGWNDERSKSKISEFKKMYGDSFLNVIYASEYNKIKKEVSNQIEGWEN